MRNMFSRYAHTIRKIRENVKFLQQAFAGYKRTIFTLVVLSLCAGVFEGIGINMLIPLLSFVTGEGISGETDRVTKVLQDIFTYVNISFSITNLLIFIVILFLCKTLIVLIFNYIKVNISSMYEKNMRHLLLLNTILADWRYLSQQKIGYLENVLMNDVRLGALILQFMGNSIMVFFTLFVYMVFAFNISWPITMITLGFGIVVFLIFQPLVRRARHAAAETTSTNKKVAHYVNEKIIGMKSLKIMSIVIPVINQGDEFFERLRKLRIKTTLLHNNTTALIELLGVIFIVSIFSYFFLSGDFQLASFVVIIYLIQRIFSYINQLQASFHKIHGTIPYLKNVIQFLDASKKNKEIDLGKETFSFKEKLSLSGISFSYQGGEKDVLKNISLEIKKGEMVGIIGPSGAGKTTVVDLLLRLYIPQSGKILIDDKNIVDISTESWRKNIGYVPQDSFLLNDTVFENIRFYDTNISEKDVREASKKAHILDTIETLPNKFDTIVGERGTRLSVGQRQRISIARVLARNPGILILDEATSALDNESEIQIQKVLRELKRTVTILIIAHRLSTVSDCDRLVALLDGKIVEEGEPSALLKDKDSYFYKVNTIHG